MAGYRRATDYTGTRIPGVLAAQERSISWLARRMGMSQPLVWRVLHGERAITRRFVDCACAALGLPEEVIFVADDIYDAMDNSRIGIDEAAHAIAD